MSEIGFFLHSLVHLIFTCDKAAEFVTPIDSEYFQVILKKSFIKFCFQMF